MRYEIFNYIKDFYNSSEDKLINGSLKLSYNNDNTYSLIFNFYPYDVIGYITVDGFIFAKQEKSFPDFHRALNAAVGWYCEWCKPFYKDLEIKELENLLPINNKKEKKLKI